MTKRVLVTGGAGFLGSHLCARLLSERCEVLCVDNYFTGTRRNIEPLLSQGAFEAIRHDVTFPLYVEVDEIFNLACPASPIHYQHDPVQTTKTCVVGAINMLGLAKRLGARILQASTSEVYGDPHVHPQPEAYRGLSTFGSPRLLRRGKTLRRDPVFRLSPPAWARHQGGAHLQYLRPEHAPARRTRRFQLHRPGAAQRADHGLWLGNADPVVLLCRRSRRRSHPPDEPRRRSRQRSQPWQPGRSDGPRIGATYHFDDRIALQAGAAAAAPRRPPPALPRHYASAIAAGLDAQGPARRWV